MAHNEQNPPEKVPQEPISVSPTKQPKHGNWYYVSMALFVVSNLVTMLAIVLLQLPSLLFYYAPFIIVPFLSKENSRRLLDSVYVGYRSYIRFTEGIWGSFITILLHSMVPGHLVISGDSRDMGFVSQCIVMANHQIYPDWIYLWALARRYKHHSNVKIFLMAVLKYLPLAGIGMLFFEFVFLERKLKLDRKRIRDYMARLKRLPNVPLWLLLFPEGTLNTPNNRTTSRAFAKKADIKEDPKYVLLPKGTGLFMAADVLMPNVNTLFDLTVGYSGLEPHQIPYEEYLTEHCFFAKQYPKEVHIHIKKYDMKTLPGFDGKITEANVAEYQKTEVKKEYAEAFDPVANARREEFNLWLRKEWMSKDDLMHEFYKTGRFPGSEKAERWDFKYTATDVLSVGFAWSTMFWLLPLYWRLGLVFLSKFLSVLLFIKSVF